MKFSVINIERFVRSNTPTIMSTLASVGVGATAYLTGKATWRAKDRLAPGEFGETPQGVREVVPVVWELYIPAAFAGASTVALIVGAHRASARRISATQALLTMSERAYAEYSEKVVEKIGAGKEKALRDEIAQDRMDRQPPGNVIVAGSGDVLCYEVHTGRYFTSDMETLKKAMNTVNRKINVHDSAYLSDFYDEIHLPYTGQAFLTGWEHELMDLEFSTTLSEDGRPCISFDYNYLKVF